MPKIAKYSKKNKQKKSKKAKEERNETLEEQIIDLVNGISKEDERGANIDVIVRRIDGYSEEEVRSKIEELIKKVS